MIIIYNQLPIIDSRYTVSFWRALLIASAKSLQFLLMTEYWTNANYSFIKIFTKSSTLHFTTWTSIDCGYHLPSEHLLLPPLQSTTFYFSVLLWRMITLSTFSNDHQNYYPLRIRYWWFRMKSVMNFYERGVL